MPLAPLGRLVLPGAKAAEKRVCVVAYAASGGQLVEVLCIASAQHHVIGLERGDEMHDHVFDMLPPFLLAVSGQSFTNAFTRSPSRSNWGQKQTRDAPSARLRGF
jgi:hypothetical protein